MADDFSTSSRVQGDTQAMREVPGRSPDRGFGREFALFAGFDLVLCVAIGMTWALTGLASVEVLTVTTLARSGVWLVYLHQRFAPIRRFRARRERASDAEIMEADACLQNLARGSSVFYVLSWILTDSLWVAVSVFELPLSVPLGEAEWVASLLFVVSTFGLLPLYKLMLESTLGELRGELGLVVFARKLPVLRTPTSFLRSVVVTAMWMVLGGVFSAGGGAVVWSARVQRAHAIEIQAHRVDHGVTRVRTGGAVLDGVELASLETLPAELVDALERAGLGPEGEAERVTVHDLELGLAIAAVRLDDGRVILSAAKPVERCWVILGILLVIGVTVVPMFGLGFWLFGRMFTLPLAGFTDATRQFVDKGELQGLERIAPVREDELGRLAVGFNGMLDVLDELTVAAAAVSDGDLSIELDHPGALHDAFRGMLVRLNAIVSRMRETSLELASAAAEISALTEEQERAALSQSNNIQQLAQTVHSLAGSAKQIAAATSGVRRDAEQTVTTTQQTAEQIVQLRLHTTSIAELLLLLAEVASRSDLLALNGSLEATRAGEAGRGFALVAAEMRRLAERVAGTVEDVRGQVVDIEASSGRSVAATEQSRILALRTAEATRAIDQLTSAQSTDTAQASIGVESTANMVVKASFAMSQIRAATGGLHAHAVELERLLSGFELRAAEGQKSDEESSVARGASSGGRDRSSVSPSS